MNIALIGYGKMGKTIEKLALPMGHKVVFTTDGGRDEWNLKEADVAIEFSVPEAAPANIAACLEAGVPVVSGTTGWISQMDEVLKKCESCNGAFIYASNFSIGVNLFFELNDRLAKLMSSRGEYQLSMEEIHHTQKLDAPSGTAISLAEGIIANTSKKGWKLDEADKDEIPIRAIRLEDVKGTHIVRYSSDADSIEIKHEAHSREGFAHGALLAAEWLQDKIGVFTMKDVLQID